MSALLVSMIKAQYYLLFQCR